MLIIIIHTQKLYKVMFFKSKKKKIKKLRKNKTTKDKNIL